MIDMSFRFVPSDLADLDYRPVGDAIHQAGEDLASAVNAALSGTVFPGMTGPVNSKDASAVHTSFGEFEFSVTGPDVSKIEEGKKPWDMKCIVDPLSVVFTVDGWKRIGEIRKGDLVLTHKGRFRRVLATSKEPLEENQDVVEVSFFVSGKKQIRRRIIVTGNHPFLVNDNWIQARNMIEGMKLKILSLPCANPSCSNLAPYYRTTCSKSCHSSLVNLRAVENETHPMMRDENKLKQSRWMVELNHKLLKEGCHVTQRPDVKEMWNRRIAAGEHPFQIEWRERPEELMYSAHRALGAKHHGKTALEDKMDELLKELGFSVCWSKDSVVADYVRQFKFIRSSLKPHRKTSMRNRWYFIDFADPLNKIAIECNGERWHTPATDEPRIKELESAGWTVLVFYSKTIYQEPERVKKTIAALYSNHQKKYGFLDVDCTSARRVKTRFKYKFDIQVEEDESFICNGVVVHNSALLSGPRHRVNKQGEPYNIIPFKHKQEDMPLSIQSQANGLSFSFVIGKYRDELGVERNVYNWGDQLGDMSAFSPPGKSFTGYQHKTSRYSGMVNMHGTGYMTFRTVSTKSDPLSWWNPGTPANPITESVWNFMEPLISAHVENAWMKVFSQWSDSQNEP